MQRKTALIGAAFLTGVIGLSIIMLLAARGARAGDLPLDSSATAVVESAPVAGAL